MKNNKMNREEKRRLLFNKKYEISDTLHNDAETAPAHAGAAEGVMSWTKKQLYHLVALVVALCVLIPAVFMGMNRAKADETYARVTVDGLETKKEVGPLDENGVAHVKIEAYNSAEFLSQPRNDIILVLDRSNRMNTTLYQSYYKRINNRPEFEQIPANHLTPNRLHDTGNNFNNGVFSTSATVGLINTYKDDKYVEDPNTPGVYIYLSSHYRLENAVTGHCYYYYTFTDSQGNTYKTEEIERYYLGTDIGWPLNVHIKGVGDTLDFPLTFKCSGKDDVDLYAKDFYHRKSGTCVTNEDLISKRNNLYIKDINGGDPIKVNLQIENVSGSNGSNSFTYNKNYIFTFTDSDGNPHRVVQGNEEYGADNGVFQGFKNYRYVEDEDGTYHLEIIHPEDDTSEYKSYESITLYEKTEEINNISRFDALKEAVEDFLIKVHLDSCYKHTDIRVGIVTYGKDGQTPHHLTSVKDELAVNKMISNVYNLQTDKTVLGILSSEAAQIDEGMSEAYTEFHNNSTGEVKRFAVVFTAGMPTKNYWGKSSREKDYNTTVASNAVQYAYQMKQEQAVNIYSVGMYENAKASETFGKWFYYTIYDPYECKGNIGNIWGASLGARINPFREIDVTDAAAVNRLMNYISSDFLDANSIGINRRTAGLNPAGHALTTAVLTGKGYQITKNYKRSDSSHYFAISMRNDNGEEVSGDQINSDLQEVFNQLAGKMEVAQGELNGQTQVVDTISDYFNLIPESVNYYTLNYQGNPDNDPENDESWTENEVNGPGEPSTSITPINLELNPSGDELTVNTKTLTLTGFPFSENYVVADKHTVNSANNYGKKVILEFDIQRVQDFIGGNQVPTNMGNSGVYDYQSHLEEHFEIPKVDVPVQFNGMTHDQSIYYSYEADLSKLVDETKLNGFNNEFVNITYEIVDPSNSENNVIINVPAATVPTDNFSQTDLEEDILKRYPRLDATKTYQINVAIEPIYYAADGTKETTNIDPLPATVYVFVPALDVKDEAKDAPYWVDLNPTKANPAWICDLNNDNNADNDVSVEMPKGDGPELTYTVINHSQSDAVIEEPERSNYQITETQHFQVNNVTIPERSFYYYVESERQAVDENDEGIVDEDGHPVMETVVEAIEVNREESVIPQEKVKFTNTTAPSKIDGNFTKSTNKYFNMSISKEFKGRYAVAEAVEIIVTDITDPENPVEVGRVNFSADDFTPLVADPQSINHLIAGRSYLITEQYSTDSSASEIYDTTFTVTSGQEAFEDEDVTDSNAFTFSKPDTEDNINVAVLNTMKQSAEPVVTGVSENDTSTHILLIALAATVAVSAGGYGVYRVYKPKKEE